MMQQAQDFLDETEALHALIEPLTDEQMAQPTAFKNWSVNQVIRHLHMWNWAADQGLQDGEAFMAFFGKVAAALQKGSMGDFEHEWAEGLEGRALTATWIAYARGMAQRFGAADPKMRVKWAGPDMSVRSSISARLMETWAHGQEIYDLLGVEREENDRIKNVVILGVNAYGWTFKVNGRETPGPMPYLVLTAPSGAIWTFGDEGEDRIEGAASEFAQVVCQTRNILDTSLKTTGPIAAEWMRIAQCFAGPPETPPAPGTRGIKKP